MKYTTCLKACKSILSKRAEEKLQGGMKISGEKYTYTQLLEACQKLLDWVDPQLESNQLKRITTCRECIYHDSKTRMCSKLDTKTNFDFYCKDGEIVPF